MNDIISCNIRNLRKRSGYTQKQVADLLGLDRSTYSYYELGKIKPDIATIMKLANIFGVHYTEILESEGSSILSDSFKRRNIFDKSSLENLCFERVNQEEKTFLDIFRDLSKNDREETMKFMNNKLDK